MRRSTLACVVGLVLAPGAAVPAPAQTPKPKAELSKLKFMAGCWRGPLDKDSFVEEIWTTPSEDLLLATTRVLKKGKTIDFEFTWIAVTDTGVVFSASSNGKPFDEYLMTKLVEEYVEFENPKKPFPQRIMYRLASDGALIPRNEGDGQPSIEVRMKKTKCPGT